MTINIGEILQERGSRYGEFSSHAAISQDLKSVFIRKSPNYHKLTPSMREAVDMIFHKLGRIGNGDPFYLDSWVDIVGYTQLVIDELNQLEKEKESPDGQAAAEQASNK
jgi:hypothetical protein